MIWNIGIIGFGNVGQGLAKLLMEKKEYLREKYGFGYRVTGIIDRSKGRAYCEDGLPLGRILREVREKGCIRSYIQRDMDVPWLIKEGNIDILVEAIPTNVHTGEPSLTYLRMTLENGIHAVTTNKGSIARGYYQLQNIARKNGVFLRFEGTVLSGTPAMALAMEHLRGCNIKRIQGILNGTTNFIIGKMEEGFTMEQALSMAQKMGYAEQDPSSDIEGWDAALKAVILANVLMDAGVSLNDVSLKGIGGLSREYVREVLKKEKRVKLIVDIMMENGKFEIKVSPRELSKQHPLASVNGIKNAILFTTDILGDLMITGPGAGREETGYAVLSDLLSIHTSYFPNHIDSGSLPSILSLLHSSQFLDGEPPNFRSNVTSME